MKMRKKLSRTVCLLVAVIMMVAMSTTTADAASFSKAAPKGLKATCTSGVSVKVTCKKKTGATGYYFYYATKKSGKYKLGVKSTSRTGTIKGLTPGKTYYFKVKAYKGKVLKKFTKMSKPAKCKAVLKAPGVAYKDRCCCRIAIKLSGSVGAKGYKIYRSTNSTTGFAYVGATSGNTWIDEGAGGEENPELMPLTTYYYKVRSYYGSHNSPYSSVLTVKTLDRIEGNDNKYNPSGSSAMVSLPENREVLEGRNILFLGSSITDGYRSAGKSFADYIEVRDNANVKKLAKEGTNMAKKTDADDSYVNRLTRDDPAYFIPDIFACQLSLNDSYHGIGDGTLPTINFNNLDADRVNNLYHNATTIRGAIAYIDAYAHYYWPECRVVFYTVRNNGYNSQYAKMRTMLYDAQEKYGNFEIIDMWSVSELTNLKNNLSKYCLYMNDNNHPKKAGYLYQWTPVFEKDFIKWMPDVSQTFCEVKWKNIDNNAEGVLETDEVRYGRSLSYDGPIPTKAENETYTFEFVGWKNELTGKTYTEDEINELKVTRDVTFIAQFNEIKKADETEEISEPDDSEEPLTLDENTPQDAPKEGVDNENGGGSDGGSDGSGGSDGKSNGGGSESNDDITSVILSLFRAA